MNIRSPDLVRRDANARAEQLTRIILQRVGALRARDDEIARRVIVSTLSDELFSFMLERERSIETLFRLHQESAERMAELDRLMKVLGDLRRQTEAGLFSGWPKAKVQ